MVLCDAIYVEALEGILRRTDYSFVTKQLRGTSDFVNPWYDFDQMCGAIRRCGTRFPSAMLLLCTGTGADYGALCAELGASSVDLMIEAGIWRREGARVETNNYVVMAYQGVVVLTEINPWYPTCTNPNTDVYIGLDSLRLGENIAPRPGSTVLDLCSGTGIQGLLAARWASKVVSVELNEKTVPVTRFNIRLNHREDIIDLRAGSLYDVLDAQEKFDCIYANPPFIPMVDDVAYPICGGGGEDGLMVLNGIVAGLPARLNAGGEVIIFCECLGNETEVFFDRTVEKLLESQRWRGQCTRAARLERDVQIANLSELTALFNEDFDKERFCERMTAIYERLGAEYLYHLIYKIDADEYRGGKLEYLRTLTVWGGRDRAVMNPALEFVPDPSAFIATLSGKPVGTVSGIEREVLDAFRAGKTLEEAAAEICARHENEPFVRKGGLPQVRTAVIRACISLEQKKLLRKRGLEDDMRDMMRAILNC